MKLYKLIFIILAVSYFPVSHAASCDNKTYVFFGNGMMNTYNERTENARVLEERFFERIKGTSLEGTITYGISHNESYGVIADLMEVAIQNTLTDTSQFWRLLSNLESIPDYFRDNMVAVSAAVDSAIVTSNPAVQEHISTYNGILGEGNKVIVVAHS